MRLFLTSALQSEDFLACAKAGIFCERIWNCLEENEVTEDHSTSEFLV